MTFNMNTSRGQNVIDAIDAIKLLNVFNKRAVNTRDDAVPRYKEQRMQSNGTGKHI